MAAIRRIQYQRWFMRLDDVVGKCEARRRGQIEVRPQSAIANGLVDHVMDSPTAPGTSAQPYRRRFQRLERDECTMIAFDAALRVSAAFVLFPLTTIVLATLAFTLGFHLGPALSRVILVLSGASAFLVTRAWRGGWLFTVAAALGVVACLLAAVLIDVSWDGQEYHFDAIQALAAGWNPLYGDYARYLPAGASAMPWPSHYPLGTWIFGALLVGAGLTAEAAKIELPILTIALALQAYPAFRRLGAGRAVAIALAAVLIANPIILQQAFTRYNDGILGALLGIFVCGGIVAVLDRDRMAATAALAALAIAFDTKFSALLMFAAMAGGLCLVALMLRGVRRAGEVAVACGGGAVLSLLVLGWHPYATNWLAHGHPFYPIQGPGSVDIITRFEPEQFVGRSGPGKLVWSLLAQTSDGSIYALKKPFHILPTELEMVGEVDPPMGGFGPLFSGALVFAALMAVAVLAARPGRRSTEAACLAVAAIAVGSALVMPGAWWARYVPQLWIGMVMLCASALLGQSRVARGLGGVCLAILFADAALVAYGTAALRYDRVRDVRHEISRARRDPQGFCGAFGTAHSRIAAMREAGASVFVLAQSLPLKCAHPTAIPYAWEQFGDYPAQACPCSEIAHGPAGSWVPPVDHTLERMR